MIPHSGGDGPVECESHDEDKAAQAVGIMEMGLFDAEPLDLKSENMGSMPTAVGIGQGAEIARRCGHGDNPGLRVPGVVDNADIVCDALGREGDIFKIVDAG